MKVLASPSRNPSWVVGEQRSVEAMVQNRSELFPIVAIGASAGGLEAFSCLLGHLPEHTGMGFVFVQHLNPAHSSALQEILSRATKIPAQQIAENTVAEPDHLYIIPPNADMVIKNGVLRLSPRTVVRGQHRPVDTFFSSLASDRGEKAVGVILSGTADDGAVGCAAIKSVGGITFAQDQITAKYNGMPRNAVSAGSVDFVLSPEDIAAELARVAEHFHAQARRAGREQPLLDVSNEELQRVFAIIQRAKGVDFSQYKEGILHQRIRRRMLLNRVQTVQEYLELLQASSNEQDALYRDILVNASGFFRDPALFETLSKHIFPQLVRDRKLNSEPVRVWIPGCATGEDAYSLGISLLEYIWSRKESGSVPCPAQIFGTDISESALNRARTGLYPDAAVADVSPQRLKRFFTKMDGGYQVNKNVREAYIFAKQNIAKDPPFSRLDLIICRNLLMYLSPVLQRQVIPALHYGLKPGGYLVLGGTESLSAFADHFSEVDKKHRIYQKKSSGTRLITYFTGVDYSQRRTEGAHAGKAASRALSLEKAFDRLLADRFVPASIVVNSDLEIVQFRGKTGAYLEPAVGHATFSLAKMAREGLLVDLRNALSQAKKRNATVRKEGVRVRSNGSTRLVNIEVIPIELESSEDSYYLVVFHDAANGQQIAQIQPPERTSKRGTTKSSAKQHTVAQENQRLKRELRQLRQEMQVLIEEHETTSEEFKSANEEVLSANEELQSANEELETAKEELQSSNEELTTLNEEVQCRNSELTAVNNDLLNLFSNANIPMIMVNQGLCMRRFTPAAERLLNLLATDIGRPLGHIRGNLEVNCLEDIAWQTVESAMPHEMHVQDNKGSWYLMRAKPYLTQDNRIDGAVISFQDIDALKHSLEGAKIYADTLIETAREPILILDRDLHILVANHAFYGAFRIPKADVENQPIDELADRQWDIPRLREMLDEVIRNNTRIEDFQVRHKFPELGERILLLNARRMNPDPKRPLIILAIEDVTDKHTQVEALIRQSELLDLARDAVVVRDLEGTIHYWNRGAEEMYGWNKSEALGKRAHDLLCTEFPQPWEKIEEQLRSTGHWEGELRHTRKDGLRRLVGSRWAISSEGEAQPVILEINTDITEQRHSEESLRQLSGYLMQVQDEERRRIARELHDSTGQKLAAAKLQLDTMVRDPKLKVRERDLIEASELIDETFQEIRTLSQLLHPPLLDAAGLISATRWMAEGFSNRANVAVKFNVSGELGRLPQSVELALFRVAQECLNNIRRHSGAKEAEIALTKNGTSVILQVRDNGRGIAPEVLSGAANGKHVMGVGILGMKERLSQLGGTLEITSDKSGTTVRAVVPVGKAASSSAY